jgi:hypothetical protein
VLLLFSSNDTDNNGHGEQYGYYKPFFTVEGGKLTLKNNPVPRATVKQTLRRLFIHRTYTGKLLYGVKERALDWFSSFSRDKNRDNRQGPDDDEEMLVTGELIKAINGVCNDLGSSFVLVAIPSGRRKQAALQAIAEKEGFPLVLLDTFFKKPESDFLIPGDSHWNAKGHKVAAEAIDGALLKLGIFTSPRSSLGRQ